MNGHTAHSPRFAILGTFASEAWNAAVATLEAIAFGGGVWLALYLLRSTLEEPPLAGAMGPAAPFLAGALFLVGRLWVGIEQRGTGLVRLPEALLAGMLLAIACRGAGWGFELAAAHVPIPESLVAGLVRGLWQAAALVAPYATSADRGGTPAIDSRG